MKSRPAAPSLLLIAVTLFCVAMAFGLVAAATSFQSIGLRLSTTPAGAVLITDVSASGVYSDPPPKWGTILLSIGKAPPSGAPSADWPKPVAVTSADLVPEPDSLGSYAEYHQFLDRQSTLADIMASAVVDLQLQDVFTGEQYTAQAHTGRRSVLSLTDGFWLQALTGMASVLIAGWVWALRPRHVGPNMFLLSAIGLMTATATSAIYANRELALPAEVFTSLVPINHAGVIAFSFAMIALLLNYPRQIIPPKWLWLLAVFGVGFLTFDMFEIELGMGPSQLYVLIATATFFIAFLIGLQWWRTRDNPSDRAALGWLGLSIIAGAGAYTLLGVAPILLNLPFGLPQSHVTAVLLIIYIGLAFGLSRYRLFELGDWSFRVLFYTVGALLLLAVDALVVYLLNIDVAPALGIALILVGFVYLPTRDWIWRRATVGRRIEQDELFSSALDVAFAGSPAESAIRWRALLKRLFDPLEIVENNALASSPSTTDDGLVMQLPAVAGSPPLRLTYPFAGRGLFSPNHLKLATDLVALTERADEGRAAYMRGVGEERRRMARDLHDDVGARLLTGLHTADETTRPTLQAALSDIRAIVSGLAGDEANLDRVFAETRHEAARRLEAAGIALHWPLADGDLDLIQLDYRLHKAMTSAVREIVSNVIRHSQATSLTVRPALAPDRLSLVFSDNGQGLPTEALAGETQGYGLRNLRHRIEDVGGHLSFSSGQPGTVIAFDIPLVLAAHTPKPGVPTPPTALNSTA